MICVIFVTLKNFRYMDVMEIFKPDIILAIADGQTSLSEGSKRLSKSVDRTTNMLKICVERYKAAKELQNSALVGMSYILNKTFMHQKRNYFVIIKYYIFCNHK